MSLVGWVAMTLIALQDRKIFCSGTSVLSSDALTFAELSQTADRASEKRETNQQKGNPEATCIPESIADAELYIEI
jgi:hypothetical protein